MRLVNNLHNIILLSFLAIVCTAYQAPAWAVELDVQLEQTAWHYKEYEKGTKVAPNRLPSSAQGFGVLAKLSLSTERDLDYFFALNASLMDSLDWTTETWGTRQTNDLKIKQQDVRFDMQYRMLGARWGIWLAHREQTQHRRAFYVANVLTGVATAEPVPEVITSDWFGLSIASVGGSQGQFETKIDLAVPLAVKVTNPLFAQPFHKKDGQRAGVHFRWLLPKHEVGLSGLNLTLRFEYQVLGGELTATNDLWPYNRWLMASAGLLYAW